VGVARDGDWQRATVDDRGPGVPAELQASLFERRAAGRRNPGRAGLGLYFTRRAVESWGGRVGFEPRAGGGTRFWFALPAAAPADQV
jgi:signal transduction histidine kinase